MKVFAICDTNHFCRVLDGLLVSEAGRVCYGCIGELGEVTLLDSVRGFVFLTALKSFVRHVFLGVDVSRVMFSESTSLKLIGQCAFRGSGVQAIPIPGSVEETCEECFYRCTWLECITFGDSSSSRLVGARAFCEAGLIEIHCPKGIEDMVRDAAPHCVTVMEP